MGKYYLNSIIKKKCIVCNGRLFKKIFKKKNTLFYRCVNCGFENIYPLPTIEELINYYNKAYRCGVYKEYLEATDLKMITAKYRYRKIEKYIKGEKLLDIGCSEGHFVKIAHGNGIEAEGIDISKLAISYAKKNGVRAFCSDAQNYYPGYRFQTITGFDVLEHVLNPNVFIESIKRLLIPNGTLVLSTPNIKCVHKTIMGKNWYHYVPEEHFHYFNSRTITMWLKKNNFSTIRCKRFYKPITIEYGLKQIKEYNPLLFRIFEPSFSFIPIGLKRRSFPIYIGELLVTATNST